MPRVRLNGVEKSDLKGKPIYLIPSIGRGLAVRPYGSEQAHLEAFVNKINELKDEDKPSRVVLVDTGALQAHGSFKTHTIEEKLSQHPKRAEHPVDPLNKMKVLSDDELIAAFKGLQSNAALLEQIRDKKMDCEVAATILAAMFKPISENAGLLYTEKLKSTWNMLKAPKVEIINWQQAIDEDKANYVKQLEIIEAEYAIEGSAEREAIDRAIKGKVKEKEIIEVSNRFIKILSNRENFKGVTEPSILEFFEFLLKDEALEASKKNIVLIALIASRNYFLTEIAYMCTLAGKGMFFYPGKPLKPLIKIFESKKIPWKEIEFFSDPAPASVNHHTIPGLTKKREGSESSVSSDFGSGDEAKESKSKENIATTASNKEVKEEKGVVNKALVSVAVNHAKEKPLLLPNKQEDVTLDRILEQDLVSSSDDSGQEEKLKSSTSSVTSKLSRIASNNKIHSQLAQKRHVVSPKTWSSSSEVQGFPNSNELRMQIDEPSAMDQLPNARNNKELDQNRAVGEKKGVAPSSNILIIPSSKSKENLRQSVKPLASASLDDSRSNSDSEASPAVGSFEETSHMEMIGNTQPSETEFKSMNHLTVNTVSQECPVIVASQSATSVGPNNAEMFHRSTMASPPFGFFVQAHVQVSDSTKDALDKIRARANTMASLTKIRFFAQTAIENYDDDVAGLLVIDIQREVENVQGQFPRKIDTKQNGASRSSVQESNRSPSPGDGRRNSFKNGKG